MTVGLTNSERIDCVRGNAMNPRQKKEESLRHDRRNAYGENDKSSRKAIRRRKRWVNQTYRRAVRQALVYRDPDDAQDGVSLVQRNPWKKVPDEALGDMLRRDLNREVEAIARRTAADSSFSQRLERKLTEDGWAPRGVQAVVRQFRSVALHRCFEDVDLGLTELREFLTVLHELDSGHGMEVDDDPPRLGGQ